MEGKKILLMSDSTGYGTIALPAMLPVLTHMGAETFALPTALISNPLNFGKFEVLDTTEYMRGSLKVWRELGFQFDAVFSGFLTGEEQAEFVTACCEEERKRGAKIFCDPIMGDIGHLYNGMNEQDVVNRRKLVSAADYVFPNYTEAALLAGEPFLEAPTDADIRRVIDALREMGAGSVIVTSAGAEGAEGVACYDAAAKQYFTVPHERIPVRFGGTGDIFSAIVIGSVMNGASLEVAVSRAVRSIPQMIRRELADGRNFLIRIDQCLDLI